MRLTLLGSGNAAGMPLYGCHCQRCLVARANSELRRGPTSAMLEVNGKTYLIDAGQMDIADKYPAGAVDGFMLTHFHADHVQGLFHLRWGVGSQIPVYCPPDSFGCDDLFAHPGILDFRTQRKFESFMLDDLIVTPLPLIHSKVTFGYLLEYENKSIAYLTDTKGLPPRTLSCLKEKKLELLVIDTSYPPGIESSGHNNLDETLAIHKRIDANRVVLTHIGHDLDVWLVDHSASLPSSVVVGRDNYSVYPY